MKIDPSWNLVLPNAKYIKQIEVYDDKIFLSGDIGEVDSIQRGALLVLDKSDGRPVYFPSPTTAPNLYLIGDTLIMGKETSSITSNRKLQNGFGYIVDSVSLFDEGGTLPLKPEKYGKLYNIIPNLSDGRDKL